MTMMKRMKKRMKKTMKKRMMKRMKVGKHTRRKKNIWR